MSWYIVLKFFHIISVILFVGGLFARQLVRRSVKKTDDIRLFMTLTQAALAEGQITPHLRAAMDDRVVRLAHLFEEVSVLVIVALMVLKPF